MPTIARRPSVAGFTLVEILIVVVILGVLAAIVIPQFSSASDTARANTMYRQLQTLRRQLDLYKLHHNNEYPQTSQLWASMINRTQSDGTVDAAGPFGPYIERAPLNVFTASFSVAAVGAGTAGDGWEYDAATGVIAAVGFDEAAGVYTPPD